MKLTRAHGSEEFPHTWKWRGQADAEQGYQGAVVWQPYGAQSYENFKQRVSEHPRIMSYMIKEKDPKGNHLGRCNFKCEMKSMCFVTYGLSGFQDKAGNQHVWCAFGIGCTTHEKKTEGLHVLCDLAGYIRPTDVHNVRPPRPRPEQPQPPPPLAPWAHPQLAFGSSSTGGNIGGVRPASSSGGHIGGVHPASGGSGARGGSRPASGGSGVPGPKATQGPSAPCNNPAPAQAHTATSGCTSRANER